MASKKTKRTELGQRLIAGLKEAVAHSRGEIALEGRVVEAMPPSRVKAIVRKVASSPKDFERKFGVPARTIEGWEQNKKLDVAGRVLLTVIERNPKAVQKALAGAK
jgi:putative transcriptional regulator